MRSRHGQDVYRAALHEGCLLFVVQFVAQAQHQRLRQRTLTGCQTALGKPLGDALPRGLEQVRPLPAMPCDGPVVRTGECFVVHATRGRPGTAVETSGIGDACDGHHPAAQHQLIARYRIGLAGHAQQGEHDGTGARMYHTFSQRSDHIRICAHHLVADPVDRRDPHHALQPPRTIHRHVRGLGLRVAHHLPAQAEYQQPHGSGYTAQPSVGEERLLRVHHQRNHRHHHQQHQQRPWRWCPLHRQHDPQHEWQCEP